jgi:hypothetical protein
MLIEIYQTKRYKYTMFFLICVRENILTWKYSSDDKTLGSMCGEMLEKGM